MDNTKQILQKYSAEYQAFYETNRLLQLGYSFDLTKDRLKKFSNIFLPFFTSTQDQSLSRDQKKNISDKLKNAFEKQLNLFYRDTQLEGIIQNAENNAQACNKAIEEKLAEISDTDELKNLFERCKITIQVRACGAKSSHMVETYFMLPPLDLLGLPKEEYPFVTDLVQSNGTGERLIKINDQFIEQWLKLTPSMQESLKPLKIDIDSQGETIGDKLIRHVPLMLVVAIPHVLNRHSTQIANFMGIYQALAKTMNFFVSIGASYSIGQHVFPQLDASCNSHVFLLKKYFGKNVRTRIRRGESFLFFSFIVTALSYITCTPEDFFSINMAHGIFLYIALLALYSDMNARMYWNNPIKRGAPELDQHMVKDKREGISYIYRLKHLKNFFTP